MTRFAKLELRLPEISAKSKRLYFILGLKANIQSLVNAQDPEDLESAMNLAIMFADSTIGWRIPKNDGVVDMELGVMRQDQRCWFCKGDHIFRYCNHPRELRVLPPDMVPAQFRNRNRNKEQINKEQRRNDSKWNSFNRTSEDNKNRRFRLNSLKEMIEEELAGSINENKEKKTDVGNMKNRREKNKLSRCG